MPTKRNHQGKQQPYVPAGNGDKSGEYRGNETSPGVNTGVNNVGLVNNYLDYQTKPIPRHVERAYNKNTGGHSDEFRRIQAESLGMHDNDISKYHAGERTIDETLRERLSRAFKLELQSSRSSRNYSQRTLLNPKTNDKFYVYENVDGNLFHDIFQINRNYLKNGELVDLHDNYNDCTCFLSDDGLSGFAITKDGDLISVFNLNGKGGFLKTIAPIVREKAKTLDCYASPNQNLQKMYSKIFGFKTAAIMDYNMEFDHDNIAKNHIMPKVAFMVNTNGVEIKTIEFKANEYDKAVEYQKSFVKKEN